MSRKIVSTNPSRNFEVIGEVEMSSLQDVKDAVNKARSILEKWSSLSVPERCTILQSFIDISKKRFDEIVHIISLETGRPLISAKGNVQGGINSMEIYIQIAQSSLAPKITHETDTEIHRVYPSNLLFRSGELQTRVRWV